MWKQSGVFSFKAEKKNQSFDTTTQYITNIIEIFASLDRFGTKLKILFWKIFSLTLIS